MPPPTIRELRARLADLTLRDERRLRRRLDRARKRQDPEARQAALAAVAEELAAAEARIARRRAAVPELTYPDELPITGAREELLAALRDSQVVVVAGETGSGKTTQLPKLCLELGRGVRGHIGHTQPRRIAASSVAARLAHEVGSSVGKEVGYKIRFSDRTSEDTLVKLVTDGMLLAETGSDPALRAYDTIIVDEAHERSLNIDFLLGYLKQLLPRRPDLQVIITSATIDVDRFSRHFDDAPIVEVSGRTYPVEVRYRPLDDPDDGEERDQPQAVCDAVDELDGLGRREDPGLGQREDPGLGRREGHEGSGDILVFLPGERDIRETAEALRARKLAGTEILPLHARLPTWQQQRVFQPHRARRIVLATNVAETSLTVPGIRSVIDVGTARISRYSPRTKVQRLPIERVSQASADQRAGRCGREGPGVCIRLYSEADYAARPQFTDPEIQRTNLASVILQMTDLGLGDIGEFPFVDPPDRRHIHAALQLLDELGAVERDRDGPLQRLTPLGRTMAALPVDPRLARMIVEAHRTGCLREVLVIAAAMSVQDPRERPVEHRQQADAWHARFAAESDFLSYLRLWDYLTEQQRALSSNQFKRQCRTEFLHHGRVREWIDLHRQLRSAAVEQGLSANDTPAEADQIHRALLAGLLSHVGMRPTDAREYVGARGTRFALWPGSGLAASRPPWVMAGELVETSRLWARDVARIHPEWAEQLAGHLVERSYGPPWWDRRRGAPVAHETVTLYGVPLITGRPVTVTEWDPPAARELFIRHALVAGDWDTHNPVVADNRRRLTQLADLEHRARRRDLVATDDDLYDLYDAVIPDWVVSAAHFASWWAEADAEQREQLAFSREQLVAAPAADVDEAAYPDVWRHGELELTVTYRFEPGAADDGVTVHVPLTVLNRVRPAAFSWQVPGLRQELVIAWLRALPKDLRRHLVPVPETARAALDRLTPSDDEALVDALGRELHRLRGVTVPRDAWDATAIPDHLRMTFHVTDDGTSLAAGKDLAALQRELAGDLRGAVTQAAADLEQHGHTDWAFGDLPQTVTVTHHGQAVQGRPALVDEGATVGVRVLTSPGEQRRAMWAGTRRLLRLTVPLPTKTVHARLDNAAKLTLSRAPHGSVAALLDDCATAAFDALIAAHGGPAWDADGFAKLRDAVATGLVDTLMEILGTVQRVIAAADEVDARLAGITSRNPSHRPNPPSHRPNPSSHRPNPLQPSADDARAHRDRLVHPGFVTATGFHRLTDLVRYLQGIAARLDKLGGNAARDRERMARVSEVRTEYVRLLRRLGPEADETVAEIRWLLEELRVQLFAQHLGTRQKVSEQRILRAIAELDRRAGS